MTLTTETVPERQPIDRHPASAAWVSRFWAIDAMDCESRNNNNESDQRAGARQGRQPLFSIIVQIWMASSYGTRRWLSGSGGRGGL